MSYLTPDWLMQDLQGLTRRTSTKAGQPEASQTYNFEWKGDDYGVTARRGAQESYKSLKEQGYAPQSLDEFAQSIYNPGDKTWRYGGKEHDVKRNLFRFKGGEAESYNQYLLDVESGTAPKATGQMSGASIFDREGLVKDIGVATGVDAPPAESFTEFTPDMFKRLRTEYYQPEIEEARGSLVDQLISKQRMARAQGRGLAGYGRREAGLEGAQAGFRSGVEDIYTDIEGKRAGALQDIYDVMSQYETIGELG